MRRVVLVALLRAEDAKETVYVLLVVASAAL